MTVRQLIKELIEKGDLDYEVLIEAETQPMYAYSGGEVAEVVESGERIIICSE